MLGEAYVAQAQNMDFGFDLAVRTTGDPRRMEQTVGRASRAEALRCE